MIHILNSLPSDETVHYINSAKDLLAKYDNNSEVHYQINRVSDIYFLLLQQTLNPPTYQSGNFKDFSLSSLKL